MGRPASGFRPVNRATELGLIERLLVQMESGATSMAPDESRLDTSVYWSPERHEAEQRVLFRRRPIILAHSSEVAEPGSFLTHDTLGVPILVLRDREGVLRAFLNVCRHRGSRVVRDERGQGQKAFVCGYHGWTYGLDGALMHIPHPEGFPRTDCDRGLVPVPVESHGGFIWALPTPGMHLDMVAYLGELTYELSGLGLDQHVVYRTAQVRRKYNWKLMIDAFLDGYHLRQLHRNSVYRFFLDNMNISDSMPPHIRSIVARKDLRNARTLPREEWRLRDVLSLTYFLFPNTVLVFHPDWVSRITLFPVTPDETIFTHTMIIPPEMSAEEHRPHWNKTWDLIHGSVFEREDMAACERIQSSVNSGFNESFALGRYGFPIHVFHGAIEEAIRNG